MWFSVMGPKLTAEAWPGVMSTLCLAGYLYQRTVAMQKTRWKENISSKQHARSSKRRKNGIVYTCRYGPSSQDFFVQ